MVTCEELHGIIERWENVNTEFKSRRLLAKTDRERALELAAQLTSLANRFGGRLVFGVEDDLRQVEKGGFEGKEKVVQWIANVNRDSCSPPTEISHEFLQCDGGEVLVIHISRRKAMPHAVVPRREGQQIKERVYYARNNHGKQLVTDIELSQMFLNVDYPELAGTFPFAFSYRRDPPGGVFSHGLPSRSVSDMPFIMSFQGLTREQLAPSSEGEAGTATRLVAEVFPYAALALLGPTGGAGWGARSADLPGGRIIEPPGPSGMRVQAADIPSPPAGSMLPSLYPNIQEFWAHLLPFGDLALPPASEIRVEYDLPLGTSRLVLWAEGAYEVRVTYRGAWWSVGLPAGHPLQSEYLTPTSAQDPIASVAGTVEFSFTLDFGKSTPGGLTDYYSWAKGFLRILTKQFSWESYLEELPDPFVLRTYLATREILDRLTRLDQRGVG